jgi:hypothetical protein
VGERDEALFEGRTLNETMKEFAMSKLSVFTTAAVLLVAATAPSLAATRSHRAPVTQDPSATVEPYNAPYGSYARAPLYGEPSVSNYQTGYSLPYADRPYGDPDRD